MEAYRAFPEEGTAPVVEQMPKLIAEGRVPMSLAGIMRASLNAGNFGEEVNNAFIDNGFATGDGVIYHPNGKVKIVLDSQHLRTLTLESQINDRGALVLTEEAYRTVDGTEFRGGLTEIVRSGKEAGRSKILRTLARGPELLEGYIEYALERAGVYRYNGVLGTKMDCPEGLETPELKALWIGNAKNGFPIFEGSLDSRYAQMIGVSPEVLNLPVGGKGKTRRISRKGPDEIYDEARSLGESTGMRVASYFLEYPFRTAWHLGDDEMRAIRKLSKAGTTPMAGLDRHIPRDLVNSKGGEFGLSRAARKGTYTAVLVDPLEYVGRLD